MWGSAVSILLGLTWTQCLQHGTGADLLFVTAAEGTALSQAQ